MSQPITKNHLTAIALHISDVLGDTDTSRAEVVMEAMGLSPTSTYNTLAAITQAVVTEALTDAGVKIPSLRRGTITALFAHVRPGAPTCNRCGRLPLTLVDVAWATVTETICPRDSGLYEAEVVALVRSWTDGREYPAGTKATSDRIPLTEEGIRERGVSTLVDAALKDRPVNLRHILNSVFIPVIGLALCLIAWRLGIRNELLKHPAPPAVAQTCPALLADYRHLQWEVNTCRENSSQNYRALNECRALMTATPRP